MIELNVRSSESAEFEETTLRTKQRHSILIILEDQSPRRLFTQLNVDRFTKEEERNDLVCGKDGRC